MSAIRRFAELNWTSPEARAPLEAFKWRKFGSRGNDRWQIAEVSCGLKAAHSAPWGWGLWKWSGATRDTTNANEANFPRVSGAREAELWSALEQIGKGSVERGLLS